MKRTAGAANIFMLMILAPAIAGGALIADPERSLEQKLVTIFAMGAISFVTRITLGWVEHNGKHMQHVLREASGVMVLTIGLGFLLHSKVVQFVLVKFGVTSDVSEDNFGLFFLSVAAAAAGIVILRRVLLRAATQATNLPFDSEKDDAQKN